ncbi:hypothetical protein SDJN03_23247, partial [Cucurbita argyrosperma subsp. sororia]
MRPPRCPQAGASPSVRGWREVRFWFFWRMRGFPDKNPSLYAGVPPIKCRIVVSGGHDPDVWLLAGGGVGKLQWPPVGIMDVLGASPAVVLKVVLYAVSSMGQGAGIPTGSWNPGGKSVQHRSENAPFPPPLGPSSYRIQIEEKKTAQVRRRSVWADLAFCQFASQPGGGGPKHISSDRVSRRGDTKQQSSLLKTYEYVDKLQKGQDAECSEAAESMNTNEGNRPCKTNRRRQSRKESFGRLQFFRRRFTRLKAKGLFMDSKAICKIQNSEEPAAANHILETDNSNSNDALQCKETSVHRAEVGGGVQKVEGKRPCSRRQSARLKIEEPVATNDLFGIENFNSTDASQCRETSVLQTEALSEKAVCKIKLEEPVAIRDSLDTKTEDNGNSTDRSEVQERRRTSVGRPLRRAAEKIQSYKEIPLNRQDAQTALVCALTVESSSLLSDIKTRR